MSARFPDGSIERDAAQLQDQELARCQRLVRLYQDGLHEAQRRISELEAELARTRERLATLAEVTNRS